MEINWGKDKDTDKCNSKCNYEWVPWINATFLTRSLQNNYIKSLQSLATDMPFKNQPTLINADNKENIKGFVKINKNY